MVALSRPFRFKKLFKRAGGRALIAKREHSRMPRLCDQNVPRESSFLNRSYEPWQVKRDSFLKTFYQKQGLEVSSFNASLLYEPFDIQTPQESFYKVFTPFWKACFKKSSPRSPLKECVEPVSWQPITPTLDLDDLDLLPSNPNWAASFTNHWNPTRKGGL